MYGTLYTKRFSRLRLGLHFCDDSPEAEVERIDLGKSHTKCRSKEESLDYFQEKIVSLDMFTGSPTLGDVYG